jgi:hypothetical protein
MTDEVRTDVIYKVHVSPTTHYYSVLAPETAGWYTYHSQKRARQAHPALTEVQSLSERAFIDLKNRRKNPPVVGEESAAPVSAEEKTKLYLRCEACGEVFEADEPDIAFNHETSLCDMEFSTDISYQLVTEEEAF